MSTKDFSKIQEEKIAKILGWDVVSGSGARAFHPGDIQSDRWLCECKTHMTRGNPIVFYRDVWGKIRDEAMGKYKLPALFVDDGSQNIDKTWCMFLASSVSGDVCYRSFPANLRGRSSINLSFDSEEVLSSLNNDRCNYSDDLLYYRFNMKRKDRKDLHNDIVGVTNLKAFQYMFGSYNN